MRKLRRGARGPRFAEPARVCGEIFGCQRRDSTVFQPSAAHSARICRDTPTNGHGPDWSKTAGIQVPATRISPGSIHIGSRSRHDHDPRASASPGPEACACFRAGASRARTGNPQRQRPVVEQGKAREGKVAAVIHRPVAVLLIWLDFGNRQPCSSVSPATCHGRVLGVPSGLVGTIRTQSNLGFHENPYFEKNGRFFSCASCGYVVDLPHVAQVRFWRPKRPHSEESRVIWQSPSSWDKKLRIFKKEVSFFYFLWVQKWCFGSKNGVFGSLGPGVR